MSTPYFFGYGSLVNRQTHNYTDAHPARLQGWRRIWRHTDLRPVAFLTVVPDTSAEIDGLIAQVPDNDWGALDAREHAYNRVPVCTAVTHQKATPINISVYTVPDGKHGHPNIEHPILLSYIDVVAQGYFKVFGDAGVADFFNTTAGWTAPVLNDRAAPIYPRHQLLNHKETQMVDDHLAALGVYMCEKST